MFLKSKKLHFFYNKLMGKWTVMYKESKSPGEDLITAMKL